MKIDDAVRKVKGKGAKKQIIDFILNSKPNEVFEPAELHDILGLGQKTITDLCLRLSEKDGVDRFSLPGYVVYGRSEAIEALKKKVEEERE